MPIRRPPVRRLMVLSLLVCCTLILTACGSDLAANTFDPQGDHAQRIYDLMIPIFWAGLAVFVFVEGVLLYTVFRFRRRPNAGIPAQIHGNLNIEIAWTIAPALIVLVIAVLTFRTQAENSVQPANGLQIDVLGKQWYFQFVYPQQGIITATDMYIPVGRPVTLRLTGGDVIHNFWVPKLAGKTDMLPTLTNYLSFKTDKPGIYRGQCAEFCGAEHAQMGFNVIAVPQDQFDRWVAQQQTLPPGTTILTPVPAGAIAKAATQLWPTGSEAQATASAEGEAPGGATQAPTQPAPSASTAAAVPSPTRLPTPTPILQQQTTPIPQAASVAAPVAGNPENGALVFRRKGCLGCHVVGNDPKGLALLGPNLAYFGSRTEIAAGVLKNTPENLATWLRNPDAVKPGNKMATVVKEGYLTEKEITDLVAYLERMKVPVNLPVASK